MSWLEKLLGGRPKEDGSSAWERERVRIDVGRLDKVRAGLGEQTVSYICDGQNDSVLLTLKQHEKQVHETLRPQHWSSAGWWAPGRGDVLLASSRWNPDLARRYGQVLTPLYPEGRWTRAPGTERSPHWFRALVATYGDLRTAALHDQPLNRVKPPAEAKRPWTIEQFASLLDEDLTPLLDVAFERDTGRRGAFWRRDGVEEAPGFEAWLRADPAQRTAELKTLSAKARTYGLRTLARLGLAEGPWFDFTFEQAGDSAKGVREAAVAGLSEAPARALAQVAESRWEKLKPPQKIEIARIVARNEAGPKIVRRLLESEKNDSVRAELERLLDESRLAPKGASARPDGPEGFTALDGEWIAAPPLAALPEDPPVSKALRKLIEETLAAWREQSLRLNKENEGKKPYHRQMVPSPDAGSTLCAAMDSGAGRGKRQHGDHFALFDHGALGKTITPLRAQILAHPDLTLWHLARIQFRWLHYGRDSLATAPFNQNAVAAAIRARLTGGCDLRTWGAICTRMGSECDAVVRSELVDTYWSSNFDTVPTELIWPCLLEHLNLIDEAMGMAAPSSAIPLVDARAFEILALFPKTPTRYLSALLDRAIGDRKLARQPARALLAAAPDIDRLIVPLLQHPKSESRAGAATWLAERRTTSAVKPLLDAARKEKLPAPKAAMLAAISHLGGDISPFVAAKALLGEAEAGLKKTSAKGLEWFPFDALPRLRKAGGAALDPTVVRWWVVLAAKLKEARGSPWFDLLLDQLEPADASRLGLAVMQAWIAWDTVRPTDTEANAHAEQHVDALLATYRRWQPETPRERIFAMLRQAKLTQYENSGNDQKGVLALASRASGPEAVNLVQAYFRDHYTRTAQCKALLECLAANPSPVAVQYVLTIAKRWRTRSVQALAGELVTAIAERRGWTAEELADRTIPTGGFDDRGVLELPVGERTYSARLDAKGKIGLFKPDGKPVQGLPSSIEGPAAESLKESKALLATARKEVKQVLDFQTRRLYEAMCVGREWSAAEWEEHLLRHPLMGRLVQRLVWQGLGAEGRAVESFRPMDDLTLTDVRDSPLEPGAFARVRLAHTTSLTQDDAAAWAVHLKDYEVEPLFEQLGRKQVALDRAEADATEVADRKGWMIETFKLRGAATKLGYNRGQAEDGGWFFVYEKPFDALQLVAVVEFTGNGLPEQNRASALTALRFTKMRKGGLRWHEGEPLKTVPPILLSEAWNDFHDIAAAGTGFDGEWEKKSQW